VSEFVAPIKSVQPATPSTRLVSLDLRGQAFAYEAGQAALIGLAEREERVPYSIASAPLETARTGTLDFLIKVESSGRWGHQFDSLDPGAMIGVRGPFGSFTLPKQADETRFLFIAGGTGIAPIRAMVREALLRSGTRKMRLLYSAKTADDFAYLPELGDMAAREGLDLKLHQTRAAAGSSRINLAQLATLVDSPETLCFVCGPESMVADVPPMLLELGIDRRRIRVEEW
jgi:Na+-transporting NADH:ubiquinone oxidoreductase subunit F